MSIAKNATIYVVFSFFTKSINFLLLPLYTAYLTTADYGIIGIISALTAFLSTIYTLSLAGAVNRFYVEYKNNEKCLDSLYSTIFITILVNATLWTVISILGRKIFDTLLPGVNFYPYVFFGLLTIWMRPIYFLYQRILQAKQDGMKVAYLDFCFTLINVGLTVFFVVVLKQKAEGVIKAQTITAFIIAVGIAFVFLRKLKWKFNKEIFDKTMRYSLPLIPHSLAGTTTTMIDRFVINKNLGTSSVGIYNIAFQFGNIANIITAAFNQAYTPWFNQNVKNNKMEAIKKVAFLSTLAFSVVAMGLSLFSGEVLAVFAKGDFLKGVEYVPYLAFGYVLNGVYFLFATDLFYDISGGGSRKLAVITISSALLSFVLNVILIPLWGIQGAAIAFIAAKTLFAITTGVIVEKRGFVKLNLWKLISVVSLFFVATFLLIGSIHSFILKAIIYIFVIALIAIKYQKTIFKLSKKHA